MKDERMDAEKEAQDSQSRLEAFRESQRLKDEWANYLQSDPTPDAASESDLNTYLSTTEEHKTEAFDSALAVCQTSENITAALEQRLADVRAKGHAHTAQRLQRFRHLLRNMCSTKIDDATLYAVNHADEFMEDDQVLICHSEASIAVGLWANLIIKPFRGPVKPIVFKDIGLQVDIPKALNQNRIALRACFWPYDNVSDEAAQFSPDMVLGGVMQVDLLSLPPAPKTIKPGWVVRPFNQSPDALERLPFGDEAPGNSSVQQPLRCTFRVPDSVHIVPTESPKVVVWDAANHCWTTEGVHVTAVEFNADTRALRFLATRTGKFALVQSRSALFPYRKWSLEPAIPLGEDAKEIIPDDDAPQYCAHYTLHTNTEGIVVKVQIHGATCMLLEPEIKGVHLKTMPPGELLSALYRAGINLMPADEDTKALAGSGGAAESAGGFEEMKVPELESKLVQEVADLSTSFDFYSSTFNAQVGAGRCVMRMRESSVYTGRNEDTFDLDSLLVERDAGSRSDTNAPGIGAAASPGLKCCLLAQLEDDVKPGEVFSDERLQGTSSHVTIKQTVKPQCSEEAVERAEVTPVEMKEVVAEILRLTRPFSFA